MYYKFVEICEKILMNNSLFTQRVKIVLKEKRALKMQAEKLSIEITWLIRAMM